MWLIGSVTIGRAILLGVVQCLGAIVAAALVKALFSGGLAVSTTLSATTSLAQGFFIELILTAQLVFTIFMLAAEKHAGTFIAPVGIGLALFIAELTGKLSLVSKCSKTDSNRSRCLLDWWLPQSSTFVRTLGRCEKLPQLSLDILDWAILWSSTGSRVVQVG